jgi:hypothetical protein
MVLSNVPAQDQPQLIPFGAQRSLSFIGQPIGTVFPSDDRFDDLSAGGA